MTDATVDAELRRAADVVLITDAIARIAHAADHGTVEEYLELLAPDVVWEMPENPAVGVVAQTRRGRTDIADGVAERRGAGVQGPGSATRHVVTSTAAESGGDRASAVSYWRFYAATDTAPRLVSMGTYRDELARIDGAWRLAHRRIGLG